MKWGYIGVLTKPPSSSLQVFLGFEHDIIGYAEYDGCYKHCNDGDLSTPQVAERRPQCVVTYDDVAEHGQRHGEPHGDGMASDDKVGVEKQVDDPSVFVWVRRGRDSQAIEVDGVG